MKGGSNVKQPVNIIGMLTVVSVLTSCIRDEVKDCPPLHVEIAVKDKNYFNVDKAGELEDRRREDLPFHDYVPTLSYTVRNLETGEVVKEQNLFTVEGDAQTVPVEFDASLPFGKYVLTVWGGLEDITPLDKDLQAINFHPQHTQGRDVYMVNDTLTYDDSHYNHTVEMERTKGKLIIQVENLPDGVEYSSKTINKLFAKLNSAFDYSGETSVSTQSGWKGHATVTKTLLTPSLKENMSILNINFYNQPQRSTPVLSPDDIRITMSRNELTIVRYIWDEAAQDFKIYLLINDNWELVHGMIID